MGDRQAYVDLPFAAVAGSQTVALLLEANVAHVRGDVVLQDW
jgi:hypothetical protein